MLSFDSSNIDQWRPIPDGAQYTDGIAGALVVHPTAAAPSNFPTYDYDVVIQFDDWYHTLATILEEQLLSVSQLCRLWVLQNAHYNDPNNSPKEFPAEALA